MIVSERGKFCFLNINLWDFAEMAKNIQINVPKGEQEQPIKQEVPVMQEPHVNMPAKNPDAQRAQEVELLYD